MVTAIREHLEGISDNWVAGILLGVFSVAVVVSLMTWATGVIEFRRPLLEWVSSLFEWVDSFAQNTGTEMFGAFLTFILLEVIRGSREKKAQEQAEELRAKELKDLQHSFWQAQELFRLRAAETFVERQPILDNMIAKGMLKGADLNHADLQDAMFSIPDPQIAEFFFPKLPGHTLVKSRAIGANLEGANLYKANLQGANLVLANLQGARLWGVNLKDASLGGANLGEADLRGVHNFTCDQLQQAETLEGATLPDGTTLSEGDAWSEQFKEWCENLEMITGRWGNQYAKPADEEEIDHDDNDDDNDDN